MGRAEVVSEFIRRYDPLLYCEKSREGKLCVYRKGSRIESYEVNGHIIDFVRPAPYLVFALTEDWSEHTSPRDWGLEPIRSRLMDHDLWKRDLVSDFTGISDKQSASRNRVFENHIESYLKDNRREFAKATNDIVVGSSIKNVKPKGH